MKLLLLLIAVIATKAHAEIPVAYRIIANQYGVPPEVFFSIALQESGKSGENKFLPWPWTLNIDRKGYYFDTREKAEMALITAMDDAREQGKVGRVAVGIGQIYMPAHVNQFDSPIQALDPTTNLHYAARLLALHYLNTLNEGSPDWWIAVGRYHSPGNQKFATEYRHLVFKKCLRVSNHCHVFVNHELDTKAKSAGIKR